MDLNTLGRIILLFGIALAVVGGLLMVFGRVPVLKHLGHLPGDIRVEREGFSCFFPLVSMLIISILLSLALNIILRLLNR
ncbi:MAG: DUF2905 domain-containing protein [Anaerolineae bacterium]|jgi:hypothetical protein|nr:DUF2905 domain-containing protein [Anaerolineae bacterium]